MTARARTTAPWTIAVPERIATSRLVLAPPCAGDGPALAAAIRDSDDALRPWFHADMGPPAQEADPRWQTAAAARHAARFHARDRLPYLAWRGGTLTGFVESNPDWRAGRHRLSYWIRTGHHRQGYATEAVGAVIAMLFDTLDARVVTTGHAAPNTGSAALAHRLGFERIARQPHAHEMPDGTLVDGIAYARRAS